MHPQALEGRRQSTREWVTCLFIGGWPGLRAAPNLLQRGVPRPFAFCAKGRALTPPRVSTALFLISQPHSCVLTRTRPTTPQAYHRELLHSHCSASRTRSRFDYIRTPGLESAGHRFKSDRRLQPPCLQHSPALVYFGLCVTKQLCACEWPRINHIRLTTP